MDLKAWLPLAKLTVYAPAGNRFWPVWTKVSFVLVASRNTVPLTGPDGPTRLTSAGPKPTAAASYRLRVASVSGLLKVVVKPVRVGVSDVTVRPVTRMAALVP